MVRVYEYIHMSVGHVGKAGYLGGLRRFRGAGAGRKRDPSGTLTRHGVQPEVDLLYTDIFEGLQYCRGSEAQIGRVQRRSQRYSWSLPPSVTDYLQSARTRWEGAHELDAKARSMGPDTALLWLD